MYTTAAENEDRMTATKPVTLTLTLTVMAIIHVCSIDVWSSWQEIQLFEKQYQTKHACESTNLASCTGQSGDDWVMIARPSKHFHCDR